jgi:glutamine synthetase
MKPPKPVEEDVYEFDEAKLAEYKIDMLPLSIARAVDELKKDEVVKMAIGKHSVDRFIQAKMSEFDDYRMQITPWEINKYLETL